MKKIIIPFLCLTLFSTSVVAQKKATVKAETTQTKLTSQQIIDNFHKALGGKDKLEAVKSVVTEEQITAQGMEIASVTKKMGNKFRSVQTVMGQDIISVFDGTKGYMNQMGKKTDFPADKLPELAKAKTIDALGYDASKYTAGVEKIDNKEYNVLEADKTKLYFDAATGLLYKSTSADATMVIKSYKEVDGLKFVEELEMNGNGQNVAVKTNKITLNSGVSEADFK